MAKWIVSGEGILALLIVIPLAACQPARELPELYPVPNASLIDENGKAVQLDAMKGSVAVYDFIFTSCTGICPVMSLNMAKVATEVAKDAPVRFVSISVDPERDTPEKLRQYASRFRKDDRWTFLTGERDEIVKLSVEGFKLAAGDPVAGGEPLLHSSKFAVADRNGVIRQYFDGTDPSTAGEVAATVKALLRE